MALPESVDERAFRVLSENPPIEDENEQNENDDDNEQQEEENDADYYPAHLLNNAVIESDWDESDIYVDPPPPPPLDPPPPPPCRG